MKKALFVSALLASGLSLFVGCQTHDTGAYLPVNASVNNVEDSAEFVLFDEGAQNSVTCSGLKWAKQQTDGRLEVWGNVRNRDNRRIQVQVNCVFKDAQGFETEQTPFVNLFLDENAQETIHYISMNDKAQRFTIRVRQAR